MQRHNLKILLLALLLPIAARAQTVTDVLQKHYRAIGQPKLAKMQTITVQGMQTVMNRDGKFALYIKRPDMLRHDGLLMAAGTTTVIKGSKGYQLIEGQTTKEIPVNQLMNQLKYNSVDDPLYQAQQHAKAVLIYQGKDHRENKTVYKIKVDYVSGDSTIAFIDVNTNYLVMTQTYSNAAGTAAGRTDRIYSEYVKDKSGIVLPHKIVIKALIEQIEVTYTVKIDKVIFNPVLLDKMFEKP